jgi:hypothetical protein
MMNHKRERQEKNVELEDLEKQMDMPSLVVEGKEVAYSKENGHDAH